MKGCRTARALIAVAADGRLALEERFRLDRHLEQCSACRENERRALCVEEWLEGPGDRTPVVPDVEAAVQRVFATLDRGEGLPWRPRRRRLLWVGAFAAAATLAFLALVHGWPPSVLTPIRSTIRPNSPRIELATPALTSAEPELASALPDPTAWTSAGVELALRASLLEAFPDRTDQQADAPAYALFLERMRDPARAGWPLRRLVEGLLEHRDVLVARAAARCLGFMGDSGSAAALERSLVRSPVSEACFDALARLGDCAVPALERALDEPDQGLRALNRLCRIGGERAALAIERRLRKTGPGSGLSRASLLDGLTSTGRSAVAGLLRLGAAARGEEREQVLARVRLVADAGDEVVRLLEDSRIDPEVIYQALALLQPTRALPWLEARCGEHRERAAALATLAQFAGTEPLQSVRRLSAAGRVTREDAIELLRNLAQRDERRVLEDTEELIESGDAVALYDWNLLLIESEHPGVASSLARLAFCDALGSDDRQWAALAVGELGGERDARMLADLLRGRETADPRRTAACLISIHAHNGAEGVARALPGCPFPALRALLDALEREPLVGAIRVHRVVRVLDDALAGFSSKRRLKKEI